MFEQSFFLKHQGKLLWLLNTPVVRIWFRYVLRIHGEGSSVGCNEIRGILPHAIFWYENGKRKVEFRTHAKFSKRLYYAFRPLWWAMHAWDWMIADRWVPELSFGFSTLTKYPDADAETNTVDGWVAFWDDPTGATWAGAVAHAGTHAGPSAAEERFCYWYSSTNKPIYLGRSIFLFDTSDLTSGATISAAVMSLYGSAKVDNDTSSPDIDIYTSAPASNTDLVAGDFDSLGTTSQTGSPISYASFSTTGYNDFTFNATGSGNVNKTGISKFGARNANYDVANTAPALGWYQGSYLQGYFADQTGTANDPKLVVTYSLYDETVPYVIGYVTRTNLFGGTTR
jgi:hypothetical protein